MEENHMGPMAGYFAGEKPGGGPVCIQMLLNIAQTVHSVQ